MSQNTTTAVATKTYETSVGLVGVTKAIAGRPLDRETVKDLTRQVVESKRGIDRIAGDVMWDASLMLHNVTEVSNVVGGDDGLYASQGDYASALGFSKAYGSRLARLGRAIMRHDVRKGTAAWSFLCSHASDKVFGPVLGKDPVSNDEFKAVLTKAMAEVKATGKIGAVEPRSAQPDEGQGTGEGKNTPEPAKAPATYRDLLALIPNLEAVLHTLDDDGATKVHAALLKVVASDKTRRRVLADKAAKAQPKAPKAEPKAEEPTPEVTPEAQAS